MRMYAPLLIFAFSAAIYVATLSERLRGPTADAHFVSLAHSYLHGQLSVMTDGLADRPPGKNDWAFYNGRWYVVFPPLPALLIMPAVALWQTRVWDALFWAIFAGVGPACVYVLLRQLRERALSKRTAFEDLVLTALFAFGSVYYYVSVQGEVWFAAHVVACPLIALYALFSLRAERPLAAGLALALAGQTRATTYFLAPLFVIEALAAARKAPRASQAEPPHADELSVWQRVWLFLRDVELPRALPRLLWFALPIAVGIGLTCWLNWRRFGDPFEVGYRYLQIRWTGRIERWGLFHYHFFAKNLAVFLAALPWLMHEAPFVRISRHGLALWVTTPHYLSVPWPKRVSVHSVAFAVSAGCVALLDLCYQNSGWVQFGYRFSLDYSVLLTALLALGGRRFGPVFYGLLAYAIAVNAFGAVTFQRPAYRDYYDRDRTQQVIFQPD